MKLTHKFTYNLPLVLTRNGISHHLKEFINDVVLNKIVMDQCKLVLYKISSDKVEISTHWKLYQFGNPVYNSEYTIDCPTDLIFKKLKIYTDKLTNVDTSHRLCL